MMYPEHEFLDRYAAAAEDGFEAVECTFPYAWDAAAIAARKQSAGVRQVLLNAPPGKMDAGERGLGCLPDRSDAFRASVQQALEYAQALDCPRIHVMAGICPDGMERARLRATFVDNLGWAAAAAQAAGREIMIEPINQRDMPGYFLNRQEDAHAIVQDVGAANLKVQFDLYHCQIVEGDLEMRLRQYLPSGKVGHIQIAGVPARHEPDLGELNYPHLFEVIDELGYDGWIGCEYRPAAGTREGLGWLRAWQGRGR
jgi:hydroxypyruvate isomerase